MIISKPAIGAIKEADVKLAVQSVVTHHPVYTYSFPQQNDTSSLELSNGNGNGMDSNSYAYDGAARSSIYSPTANQSTATSYQYTAPLPIIKKSDKKYVRKAAEEVWVDDSLNEWPDNDYRIFVGDLAKEVTTEMMAKAFQHYKSFAKAKVIILLQSVLCHANHASSMGVMY